MTETYNQKVMWRFEDSPIFEGYTDGSTWNGWANIQCNREQFKAVEEWFINNIGQDEFDLLMEEGIKINDDQYSFAYGYTAEIYQPKKANKETLLADIYDEFFPWINEGIAKIQKQYGMANGDCSMELDMEFREAYDRLAECVFKQLKENNIIESEVE